MSEGAIDLDERLRAELLNGAGLIDRKAARSRATEVVERDGQAEHFSDVNRQRPYICSFSTIDVERDEIAVARNELDPIYCDAPCRDIEVDRAARQIVRFSTVELDGGEFRRRLIDRADKGLDHIIQPLDCRHDKIIEVSDRLTRSIGGVRRSTEKQLRAVGFIIRQEIDELRRAPNRDRQDAACKRIESTGMPDVLGVENLFDGAIDRLTRDADGLIDDQKFIAHC